MDVGSYSGVCQLGGYLSCLNGWNMVWKWEPLWRAPHRHGSTNGSCGQGFAKRLQRQDYSNAIVSCSESSSGVLSGL